MPFTIKVKTTKGAFYSNGLDLIVSVSCPNGTVNPTTIDANRPTLSKIIYFCVIVMIIPSYYYSRTDYGHRMFFYIVKILKFWFHVEFTITLYTRKL